MSAMVSKGFMNWAAKIYQRSLAGELNKMGESGAVDLLRHVTYGGKADAWGQNANGKIMEGFPNSNYVTDFCVSFTILLLQT